MSQKPMIASVDHQFPLTEQEVIKILNQFGNIEMDFGPGWTAITWKKGEPIPEVVKFLGLLRGVGNENMKGAGI